MKDEPKEVKKRINLVFPLVAYEWVKKTPFHEICNISFQEAGTMITALRSLVKLCEELGQAYLEIENEDISQRFVKLAENMRRGILFLPSLYYENTVRIEKKEESDENYSDSSEDDEEDAEEDDDEEDADNESEEIEAEGE